MEKNWLKENKLLLCIETVVKICTYMIYNNLYLTKLMIKTIKS
jgi:hypothetical protein